MRVCFLTLVAMVTWRWTLLFEIHTSFLFIFYLFFRLNPNFSFLCPLPIFLNKALFWGKAKDCGIYFLFKNKKNKLVSFISLPLTTAGFNPAAKSPLVAAGVVNADQYIAGNYRSLACCFCHCSVFLGFAPWSQAGLFCLLLDLKPKTMFSSCFSKKAFNVLLKKYLLMTHRGSVAVWS